MFFVVAFAYFYHAFAAFNIWGSVYFVQLQFCSFSELISNRFLGGGYSSRTLESPGLKMSSKNSLK